MAGETEDEIPGKILCAALVIKSVNSFVIFSCDTCFFNSSGILGLACRLYNCAKLSLHS